MEDKRRAYEELVREIMECKRCELHKYRTRPVPGEGPLDAKAMFVGEAPGRQEDLEGRPFVGAAGKLLTQLIESCGFRREQVYITNVLKCRPPGNRDPRPEEIDACTPYLKRQIEIIEPRAVICLGRFAAKVIFSWAGLHWSSMRRQHGRVYDAKLLGRPVKVVATYHPAAALYNPQLRSELERDFREAICPVLRWAYSGGDGGGSVQRSILDYLASSSRRE